MGIGAHSLQRHVYTSSVQKPLLVFGSLDLERRGRQSLKRRSVGETPRWPQAARLCSNSAEQAPGRVEDQIDPKTLEIREDGPERYTSLVDVADALPENSPRFVLLSHPVTMVRLFFQSVRGCSNLI